MDPTSSMTEGRNVTLRRLRPGDEAVAAVSQRELAAEGFVFLLDRERTGTFAAYLALLDRQERGLDDHPHRVPSTFRVAEVDGELVGRVSIRHHLTDRLRIDGGHIGYVVRPHTRRRGIATAILTRALEVAADLGIDPALVTCDEDNLGSRRVIERCGGVLEGTAPGHDGVTPVRHYLVPTARR